MGNYTQHPVINHMEKNIYICIYIKLNQFTALQKHTML